MQAATIARSSARDGVVDDPICRRLITLYFLLLMVEGALRKWILPGLSNQLLLVRDPVLLLIYLQAISRNYFPTNGAVVALFTIGVLAVGQSFAAGLLEPIVVGYGFDANFFHLPLIYLIPKVFTRDDVVKIGRWVLLFSVPMAIVMVVQFRSPAEAWINCGAGGGLGAQIRGAMGKIRPPGLFTFITGAAQFLSLATAFVLYGYLKRPYPRWFILGATLCVLLSAAVSTSRLALGGIGLVFLMMGLVVVLDRKSAGGVLGMLLPIGLVMLVATNLDIFKEGTTVFEARLEEAGDAAVGVRGTASNWTSRVFSEFMSAYHAAEYAPLMGKGLGLGTNVGARLLTGEMGFLLAESEWGRVILEMGLLLGPLYLLLRVSMALSIFFPAVQSARQGNALPLLLFGACVMIVLSGQFGQTTTVGFAVLGAGLSLAAGNVDAPVAIKVDASPTHAEGSRTVRLPRGRAPYAATLH